VITKQHPPRLFHRFFRWYSRPGLRDHIEGDLLEAYGEWVNEKSKWKADLKFTFEVLSLFRKEIIRPLAGNQTLNFHIMYRSYFTTAWRNIVKHKSFSAINIAGLALGMTCCLFISLWVRDEKAVDNFHANGKNLYSLYQTTIAGGNVNGSYTTPSSLIYQNLNISQASQANALTQKDFSDAASEVKKVNYYATGYELPWGHPETFQFGEKIQKFQGSRAGENFFTMFSYPVIAGDRQAALHDVSSMAISRKMAQFFFGTPEQAIGKSLRYENKIDFLVNAVFEDVTPQSSLQFDFVINWYSQMKQLEWAGPVVLTTFQLEEGADPTQVEAKLNRFLQSRVDKNDPTKVTVGLRPYGDRYLYSSFVNGKPEASRMIYVKIFTGVAIFILVIACINFMNLATARAMKRAREVGVRKVVGSSRLFLVGQFFGEAIMVSLFALVFSAVMLLVLLPWLNDLTGKNIILPLASPWYWTALAGLALITGIIAGSYPALYLSSLKPVAVLKGTVRFTSSSVWMRKGLVCFQFVLATGLLIATVVITNQSRFVEHTNLGYDRDNVVFIPIEGDLSKGPKYALLKDHALKMPGIAGVDRSSEAPHEMNFVVDDNNGFKETRTGKDAIDWEGKTASVGFKPSSVGFDFLNVMNVKVAEGRGFSKSFATDSADAFMVNEEAVKQMGMKDPIGKWISAWQKKGHIIGILKDFHTSTLHEPIKPLILDVKEYEYFGVILVKLERGKTKEGLASLEAVCREVNPNFPFAFKFMDQEYERLYRTEQVMEKLTNVFATLGVSISCLGLLGLVMFAAEQRTKEIGIRKVLGATVTSIIGLLSKDFLVLILISFLIAVPVAGYFMYQWLQGFAYKITLSWWIFAGAGLTVLLIALGTVALQSLQSAKANPVRSLRAE
jgi:putative ABC transport system permease protein